LFFWFFWFFVVVFFCNVNAASPYALHRRRRCRTAKADLSTKTNSTFAISLFLASFFSVLFFSTSSSVITSPHHNNDYFFSMRAWVCAAKRESLKKCFLI